MPPEYDYSYGSAAALALSLLAGGVSTSSIRRGRGVTEEEALRLVSEAEKERGKSIKVLRRSSDWADKSYGKQGPFYTGHAWKGPKGYRVINPLNPFDKPEKDETREDVVWLPKGKAHKGESDPGVLAHELGHSTMVSSPIRSLLASPGMRIGMSLGGTGLAMAGYLERNPWLMGGGALLSALPILPEEIIASYKGRKLLEKSKIKRRTLSPYVGLPTYAAWAASPLVAYSMGIEKAQPASYALPAMELTSSDGHFDAAWSEAT